MTAVGMPNRTQVRRIPVTARAFAIRVLVVPLTVGATALLPTMNGALVALAAIGTLIAMVAPASAGALPLLVLEILTWSLGWSTGQASTVRTLAFAVLLYLLHAGTALAADVPWAARVEVDVLIRWAARCVPGLLAAAGCAAVTASLDVGAETVALDVAAFTGVAAVAVALTWLATRR